MTIEDEISMANAAWIRAGATANDVKNVKLYAGKLIMSLGFRDAAHVRAVMLANGRFAK